MAEKPRTNLDDLASPFKFATGDRVIKRRGDYGFTGEVVATFRKHSGAPRYVVENDDGILHIFNADQLELDK